MVGELSTGDIRVSSGSAEIVSINCELLPACSLLPATPCSAIPDACTLASLLSNSNGLKCCLMAYV